MTSTRRHRCLTAPAGPGPWARAGRPVGGATAGAITLSSGSPSPVLSAGLWLTPPISSTTHRPKWPSTAPCRTLFGRTRLQPDTRHEFASQCAQPVVMVRLDAIPDGGLSRVRLIGSVEANARRAAGYQWFNSLPTAQAVQCLVETGMSPDLATEIDGQRPLNEGWLLSEQRHLADDSTAISFRALASMIEGEVRRAAAIHDGR